MIGPGFESTLPASLTRAISRKHGRRQRGQNGQFPSLEIGTKNQNFPENLTSAAQFRLIDLILATTVYFPV